MKSIEVNSEFKIVFLKAAKICQLEVEELKKINYPGKVFFRVTKANLSMNDLFKLGRAFERLVDVM